MSGNTTFHTPNPKNIKPCWNFHRETCIEVFRFSGFVGHIDLDVSRSLFVKQTSEQKFDAQYKPIPNYPPEKACQLYLTYGKKIGATKEALKYLLLLTTMTESELQEMAKKTKEIEVGKEEVTSKPPKRAAKVKKEITGKPVVMKTTPLKSEPKEKPVKKAAAAAKDKKPSASQMFKDLIMAGKKTDDEIFAEVKAAFGLDDSKRGYVKWYRNDLIKKGFKVPTAK